MAHPLYRRVAITMRVVRRFAVALLLPLLLLFAVVMWLLWTEAGANQLFSFAQNATEGRLQGSRITGSLAGGARIERLSWQDESTDVTAQQLRFDVTLKLFAPTVVVRNARVAELLLDTGGGSTETAPVSLQQLLENLSLPVALEIDSLDMRQVLIRPDASSEFAVDRLHLNLHWRQTIRLREIRGTYSEIDFDGNGSLELKQSQAIEADLRLRHPLETLVIEARGDVRQLIFRVLPGGALLGGVVDGSIDLSDELALTAAVELTWLDPGQLVANWPLSRPLAIVGQMEFANQSLRVEQTRLQDIAGSAAVEMKGHVDLTSERVEADIGWSDLEWPFAATDPRLSSDTGSVVLQGTFDDWNIEGRLHVASEEMPDGRFIIAAAGDRDSVEVEILEGLAFAGETSGRVAFSWREQQAWDLDLTLTGLQTASLLPEWPGTVNGGLVAAGTLQPLAVEITIDDIVGELRALPFAATGNLAYRDGQADASGLRLRHGSLQASLDGSADTEAGLAIDVEAAELGQYSNSIGGNLNANAVLSFAREDNRIFDATISSDQLEIADQSLSNVAVELTYNKQQQAASLSGEWQDARYIAEISGAFQDWTQPLESSWQGAITRLQVDLQELYSAAMRAPAQLRFTGSGVAVNDLCLDDSLGGQLCGNLQSDSDGISNLDGEMTALSLDLLRRIGMLDVGLTQSVSGDFSLRRQPGGDLSGGAKLAIAAGEVVTGQARVQSIATGTGKLQISVTDGRRLSGEFLLPVDDEGRIDARLEVRDVAEIGRSPVSGQLAAQLGDVGILAPFVPTVTDLQGQLQADVSLQGSLTEPRINGDLALRDGQLSYTPVGLQISAANLDASVRDGRALELRGDFLAGDGRGTLSSSADYSTLATSGLQVHLQGDQLDLVNLPDLQATVSPSIEVAYRQRSVTVNGEIHIPHARVTPTNLSQSPVVESEDVVVVAGRLQDASPDNEPSLLEWGGELALTLGDDVVVDLGVSKAVITGASRFNWQGGPVPQANGGFEVAGNIEAFGQVLAITEGSIRYPNVAADAPVVRLRAERDIYGNTQVKRAGVLVAGSAQRPTIEAYTVPLTTEERALTLLATGSDFDFEQGVGAVDFGTYIAPRLFISYGIGIFDRDNVISARYDLSEGFGIKASSGSKQSGVDLNYRFEN